MSMVIRLAAVLLACALPAFATVTPIPGATPQSAKAGQPFPKPVAVAVADAQGNPVAGAEVTFFLPMFGLLSSMQSACFYQSFFGYNCVVKSDAAGIAVLPGPYADVVGAYTVGVEAYAPDRTYLGSTSIKLNGLLAANPGAVEAVSGTGQTAALGAFFASPIVARVVDASGAPIANTRVTFTVKPGAPLAWWSGNLGASSVVVMTDFNGRATAPLLQARQGVGTGTVSIDAFDPIARTTISTSAAFKITFADGTSTADFTDIWWGGAAQSGWGIALTQGSRGLFQVIYTYGEGGEPRWYVASDAPWINGLASVSQGDVYAPKSAPYFAYDPSRFQAGEKITYSAVGFDDPSRGTLFSTVLGGPAAAVPIRIERYPFGVGGTNRGYAGMWWGGAAQNGWGMTIAEQAGQLFLVWFTYDASGQPIWFVMSEGSWSADGKTFSGPVFRTKLARPTTNVGSFAITFNGTQAASFAYQVEGHAGTLALTRYAF